MELKDAIQAFRNRAATYTTLVKALEHLNAYEQAKAPRRVKRPKQAKPVGKAKRHLSAAGLVRIKAAQKARWAKVRAAAGEK